ncbi:MULTISPECIES: hypothetical protein [Cyanophyceae]|uniref:hypothetical protein n=1 Tax=Cyanophyceae TaxID=3028117 RepID=UPI0016866A08|nr:hypothetical protein [Trichocoleus sp. FACHB-40]MBD2004989.1 hypothetical protein [Trichocoleus sp. FACHB-40]
MFGFIKKLFGGIAAFFGGLFTSEKSEDNKAIAPKAGKKSGYYMEFDESKDSNEQKKAEPVKAQQSQEKKPEPAKTQQSQQKKPEPAKVAASTAKKDSPKSDNKSEEKAEAAAIAQRPKVELVQTAKGVEAVPATTNGKVPSSNDTTFAPKYLNPVTSSKSRRRPGPSMSNFMDMARQVKTPNS